MAVIALLLFKTMPASYFNSQVQGFSCLKSEYLLPQPEYITISIDVLFIYQAVTMFGMSFLNRILHHFSPSTKIPPSESLPEQPLSGQSMAGGSITAYFLI